MQGKDVQKAIRILQGGGIVIFPTDTAYGIGCRIDNEDSVRRLFEVRRRPENKPMLALVNSVEMTQNYLQPIDREVQEKLIKKHWPGGLTIILTCIEEKVPSLVRAGGKNLAVRFPAHDQMIELITGVGVPVLAPSANFAGDKTPYTFEDVDPDLIKLADYSLIGNCTYKEQSTIIDCTKEPWQIIREGIVNV